MTTSSKRQFGIGIVGAVLAMTGLVFLVIGKTSVGIAMIGAGVAYTAIGMAVAGKADLAEGDSSESAGDGPLQGAEKRQGA